MSYVPPGGPLSGNQAGVMTNVPSSTTSAACIEEDNSSSRTNPRTSCISRGDSSLSQQGITRVHHIFDDRRNSAVEPISSPVHNRLNNTAISSPISSCAAINQSMPQEEYRGSGNRTTSPVAKNSLSPEPSQAISSLLYSPIQDPGGGAGTSSSGYTTLVDLHVAAASIEPKLDKHEAAQTNGLPTVDSSSHKIPSLYGGFTNNYQISGQSGPHSGQTGPLSGPLGPHSVHSGSHSGQSGHASGQFDEGDCKVDKQPALEYLRKKEEDLQHEADLREIR